MKSIPNRCAPGYQIATNLADKGSCTSRWLIRRKMGFALISTLLQLALIAFIALGMLSLSAVTLRNSSAEEAQNRARANARMALMLALGELQKHAGPDTRITAPSSIVDPDSPPLVGAWKSWEGSEHDSAGRPWTPDYESKKAASSDGGGRFLGWLVSGASAGQRDEPYDQHQMPDVS